LPLSSARDLFGKLNRDAALLNQEVTTDRFFNFVITGYSLIDWVKKDSAFASTDVQALYSNQWLKICGELANASKHFELDKRNPVTKAASSMQGWGVGRFGHGEYGIGEEAITVALNDGTTISCLDLVREVVTVWQMIFI
jgi:hypothetical protein